ncbi:hypothetical protein ACA910_018587 [Epithemia clementina (nom. ined.)]
MMNYNRFDHLTTNSGVRPSCVAGQRFWPSTNQLSANNSRHNSHQLEMLLMILGEQQHRISAPALTNPATSHPSLPLVAQNEHLFREILFSGLLSREPSEDENRHAYGSRFIPSRSRLAQIPTIEQRGDDHNDAAAAPPPQTYQEEHGLFSGLQELLRGNSEEAPRTLRARDELLRLLLVEEGLGHPEEIALTERISSQVTAQQLQPNTHNRSDFTLELPDRAASNSAQQRFTCPVIELLPTGSISDGTSARLRALADIPTNHASTQVPESIFDSSPATLAAPALSAHGGGGANSLTERLLASCYNSCSTAAATHSPRESLQDMIALSLGLGLTRNRTTTATILQVRSPNSASGSSGNTAFSSSNSASAWTEALNLIASSSLHNSTIAPVSLVNRQQSLFVPPWRSSLNTNNPDTRSRTGGTTIISSPSGGVVGLGAHAGTIVQTSACVESGVASTNAPSEHRNSKVKEQPTEQQSQQKKRKYDHEAFPQKLHRLITDVEEQGRVDIISFLDEQDGGGFGVHQPQAFVEHVMGHYYRGNSWASFRRQLFSYKFPIQKQGRLKGVYRNPLFLRGRPELSKQIERCDKYGRSNSNHSLSGTNSQNKAAKTTTA